MRTLGTLLAGIAVLLAFTVVAVGAEQPADVKALKEQVKTLQDSNVVVKEDLAEAHLQIADLGKQVSGLRSELAKERDANNQATADLSKQVSDLRAEFEKDRAAHAEALAAAQKEAAAAQHRARHRQQWLWIVGAAALVFASAAR